MTLFFQFYGLSDIGLHRQTNQDIWLARPDLGFFALADGIGGRRSGKIAAQETIAFLEQCLFPQSSLPDPLTHLHEAIKKANTHVYTMGNTHQVLAGMGTTLCCLWWLGNQIYYAHVGDSRIYRFRNRKLELLTQDHSLWMRWMKNPSLTPCPPKNIITRAIGITAKVTPEIANIEALPEDVFLLCSDGLSDCLPENTMEEILCHAPTLEEAAQEMIIASRNQRSSDNTTLLIVKNHADRDLKIENRPSELSKCASD